MLGDGFYPEEEVAGLLNLLEVKTAIRITNGDCELRGITHVVVENIDLPCNQAEPYIQDFSVDLVSDKTFEILDILDNETNNLQR